MMSEPLPSLCRVRSPFMRLPGSVCAAFFCARGDEVYREGSLRVFPGATAAGPVAADAGREAQGQ